LNLSPENKVERRAALAVVKVLHTLIWAFFAGCIVAIPFAAARGELRAGWILSCIVLAECAVLVANKGRCPLTDVAARYTKNRADNFDIYLPSWLARYNKQIFGTVFVAGEVYLILRWFSQ
jgi:hypothetical protein